MKRKIYDMTPKLYIEIAIDHFHTTGLGPVTVSEALALLHYDSPGAAYQVAIHQPDNLCGPGVDAENIENIKELLTKICNAHQSIFGDEYEPFETLEWSGFTVKAKCDEMDVWIRWVVNENGHCQLHIDHDAIDSKARACDLAALDALYSLLETEDKR